MSDAPGWEGPDISTTEGMVAQSLAGQEPSLVWDLVDQVEQAFRDECAALTGAEMIERSEKTNAILRTAWPFVLHGLRKPKG